MDFAQQQRNPAKHLVGIAFVVIFHILLVYALIHGLGKSLVDVIKKPVEVKIVEEVKPPPPPPQNLPPPPKLLAPPPPFIPPPEVTINNPPPSPVAIAPTPPVAQDYKPVAAPPAAPAPPSTGPKNARAVCTNSTSIPADYPPRALQKGINEGKVTFHFTLKANGEITDVTLASSNRVFDDTAMSMLKQLKCPPPGVEIQNITWGVDFKVPD
jgi:protein TonB